MSDFVHLHNHSDFSLLDAAQSVEMMCSRVADLGMDSIALTEHGNLFSMIPFYQAAQDKGIKPIIGCEIYVAANKHTDRTQNTTSTGKNGTITILCCWYKTIQATKIYSNLSQ